VCSPQEWHDGSKQAPAGHTTRSTAAAGCSTTHKGMPGTHGKAGVLGTVHQAQGTCTHRRCQGSQRSKDFNNSCNPLHTPMLLHALTGVARKASRFG
jgi:hypothetical protein